MLSFKDFLAVSYTQQTDQQDLNAKKRHRGVVGEEAPAQKDPEHEKKLAARLAKAKDQEMVKAHHKKLGPDPAQLRKAGKQ
jgi:hypothetical protein